MCRHSKLTEIDNITLMKFESEGQLGSVIGAFNWKKYTCDDCNSLITILNAVVEKPEGEQK